MAGGNGSELSAPSRVAEEANGRLAARITTHRITMIQDYMVAQFAMVRNTNVCSSVIILTRIRQDRFVRNMSRYLPTDSFASSFDSCAQSVIPGPIQVIESSPSVRTRGPRRFDVRRDTLGFVVVMNAIYVIARGIGKQARCVIRLSVRYTVFLTRTCPH